MKAFKKTTMKKCLKISSMIIIIYIIFSFAATRIIYDSVFQRYDTGDAIFSDEASNLTKQSKRFNIKSEDYHLAGYLFECEKKSSELIILVPGFRSVCENYSGLIKAFNQKGFDVFTFESTGHGKSDGKSAIGFPQIIRDLEAVMDFAGEKLSSDYSAMFLFGHSRGAYASCCVGAKHENICAIISVNGMNTAMDGIMAYSVSSIGSIAYANYPFLWTYQTALFGNNTANVSCVDSINASGAPVMIIQSENDAELNRGDFSIYSMKNHIKNPETEFILYSKPGCDGHTSVLYNSRGLANNDIIELSASYFRENIN